MRLVILAAAPRRIGMDLRTVIGRGGLLLCLVLCGCRDEYDCDESELGDRKCSPDNDALLVCSTQDWDGEEGPPRFRLTSFLSICYPGRCGATEDGPGCVYEYPNEQCQPPRAQRCYPNGPWSELQECDGRIWRHKLDCKSHEDCLVRSGEPQCVAAPCEVEGESRCERRFSGSIEHCRLSPANELVWSPEALGCANGCVETASGARCAP